MFDTQLTVVYSSDRSVPLPNLPAITEIAFVDPAVADIATLLAGLRSEVEPVLLTAAEPAARQMARAVAGRRGLAAIHVVAHGAPGEVSFAAGPLSPASLVAQAVDLAMLGRALAPGGGVRLWSCHTGAGARGAALVQGLTRATGRRVAASTRLVGAAARGGCWTLDRRPGRAPVRPPLSAHGLADYAGVMVTTVTWAGTTSSDWDIAANWKSGKAPAAGYKVTIPTAATNAPVLNSNSVALAALNITGTTSLTIASAGTLNLSSTSTLSSSGGLILQGGTVIDTASGGISLTTSGGISGYGVVASKVAAGSAATAAITASGGTLEVKAAIANKGKLALVVSGGADKLLLDAASAAKTLSFGSTGTLELNTAGTLTLGTALVVGGGIVQLDGTKSALTDSAGISLGTAGHIVGLGTVTGVLSGSGAVTASGGSLLLASNIAASSGVAFQIADSAASIMAIKGTVGATNIFSFLGTHGALELKGVTIATGGLHFAGTVDGLAVAASATPDLATTDYINSQKTVTKVVVTDSTHIELYNGTKDLGTITLGTAIGAGTYVDWHADASLTNHIIGSGTDIFLSDAPCYAAGTRILTPTGERAIEALRPGDIILTLSGTALVERPVKWLGQRRIDLAAHPRPETVAPIRVGRGAFADAVPHSDLWLSPDHAVFADGRLICVRQLINGATIRLEPEWRAVTYFHVELEEHAILLAQGLPAESYLDTGNHGFFMNSGAPLVLHPSLTNAADYPTREAGSCAPFVSDEASVRPIWQRLADRAAALGQAVPRPATTTDPALQLRVQGRLIRPISGKDEAMIFVLPRGTTEAYLVSRVGLANDTRPWLEDRRRLGVYVARLVVRSGAEVHDIPLDHPSLSQGWWDVERDGLAMRRWTNGEAKLSLPPTHGIAMLAVRIGKEMIYATGIEDRRQAA